MENGVTSALGMKQDQEGSDVSTACGVYILIQFLSMDFLLLCTSSSDKAAADTETRSQGPAFQDVYIMLLPPLGHASKFRAPQKTSMYKMKRKQERYTD